MIKNIIILALSCLVIACCVFCRSISNVFFPSEPLQPPKIYYVHETQLPKETVDINPALFTNSVGFVSLESNFKQNAPILTRREIITLDPLPSDWEPPMDDRRRLYIETDINGDGLEDIIISCSSFQLAAKAGPGWSIYLGVGTGHYRELVVELSGWGFGVEEDRENREGGKRLWSYHRLGGWCGCIQYLHFDSYRKKWEESPSLKIFTGDGGTDIGNGIYGLLFAGGLSSRIIYPVSTNTLSYVDEPFDFDRHRNKYLLDRWRGH